MRAVRCGAVTRRSVFETNIRALGGLLSAHLLIERSALAAASGDAAAQRNQLLRGYERASTQRLNK